MNVILLTIDCLRADHLSCLGYAKKTTPNLDNLASTGVLFSQAISVSHWTAPSFTAIFSSTYPLMCGGQLRVSNSKIILAPALKKHGYRTAAFHSNPWLSSYYGYSRGFDTFYDGIRKSHSAGHRWKRPEELAKRIISTNSKLYGFTSQVYAATTIRHHYNAGEDLNNQAIRWLQDEPRNFFLWIHYMDVHERYFPRQARYSPFTRYHLSNLNRKAESNKYMYTGNKLNSLTIKEVNELINLYDAELSRVDAIIGSLLHALELSNVLDNTFVIITADHGQQFMEHGYYGHRFGLYDELIHVPLIIIGPGLKGQLIDHQVSLLDLAPTIMDIAGIEKPTTFLGDTLLPLIKGNKVRTEYPVAITESDLSSILGAKATGKLDIRQRMVSIRTSKWKYIHTEGGHDELYCLENDPNEEQNVIDIETEVATELRSKIMAHIEFEHNSVSCEEELIRTKIVTLKGKGKI